MSAVNGGSLRNRLSACVSSSLSKNCKWEVNAAPRSQIEEVAPLAGIGALARDRPPQVSCCSAGTPRPTELSIHRSQPHPSFPFLFLQLLTAPPCTIRAFAPRQPSRLVIQTFRLRRSVQALTRSSRSGPRTICRSRLRFPAATPSKPHHQTP
jgi:hypothetical protein